jgi:uncharacterized membrane protein
MINETRKNRAFELDAMRGLAVVMMMLHHLIFDLRYLMGLDVFAWQDSNFFIYWVRAPFVFLFLFISGICCSFSRNNFKRAAKTAAVAVLFSVIFYAVSRIAGSEMYVFFNVLHLLALGTLLYAGLTWLEQKRSFKGVNAVLILVGVLFLWLSYPLSKINETLQPALLPLAETFAKGIGMADYMPLVPWMGMFLFGALFGRLFYSNRQSLYPKAPPALKRVVFPFEFTGRHALLFYLLHQPIFIGALYLFKFLGIIG